MNKDTARFIAENADKDVHQLALQATKYPHIDFPFAIRQIAGRQKIRLKVPSFYNNEAIHYPVQLSLEQSSSEITALYKASLCMGDSLVDLTGGFGVDCYFMGLNFKQVSYVERQTELCELANHNFKSLESGHISVFNMQTEDFLQEMKPVDWIFIDPARRSSAGKKVVLLADCEPDVSSLASVLLNKAQNVMVKLSPMMDISAALRDLPQCNEVHVLAVENECKEVLLILERNSASVSRIKTVNFGKNATIQSFEFEPTREESASSDFAAELGAYLYEPNAAVLKSGAFKIVGETFNLKKLHINTHLYTSNELVWEFPGRILEVNKVWLNNKVELKKLSEQLPKANISTRNYPLSVEDIRKKLKIKDGGDTYLFACTLANDEKVMIECRKKQL